MALTDAQQSDLYADVQDIKAVLFEGNTSGTPKSDTVYQRLFAPGRGTHDHAVASATEVRALSEKVDRILARLGEAPDPQ